MTYDEKFFVVTDISATSAIGRIANGTHLILGIWSYIM